MSRWRAASIHLCISAVLAGIASALLLGIWYPPPYFSANGGKVLLTLLVGVDVCIGPLMTLVVFRSGKRGLKLDLAIIGLMQAVALAYGFHVILASRPVFMVAAVDRFELVAANELDPQDLAAATKPEWRKLSWAGPVLVATRRPQSTEEHNDLLFSGVAGKDVEKIPRFYVDYAAEAARLRDRAQPLQRLRAMHPAAAKVIDAQVARHGGDEAGIVWLPIVARDADLCMLMDAVTGWPLGPVLLDPWQPDPGAG